MKKIIFTLAFATIPMIASASWWQPASWFKQTAQVVDAIPSPTPQIVEKIVEVPVEKIVEKTVEKIVEKPVYVTKTVADQESKKELEILTIKYEELQKAYKKTLSEMRMCQDKLLDFTASSTESKCSLATKTYEDNKLKRVSLKIKYDEQVALFDKYNYLNEELERKTAQEKYNNELRPLDAELVWIKSDILVYCSNNQ